MNGRQRDWRKDARDGIVNSDRRRSAPTSREHEENENDHNIFTVSLTVTDDKIKRIIKDK